ncbi:MAG: hypothetical protein PHQ66_01065 [Candidatus Nanoarchaeia archaeon]|nr:hypothetical protein [Candidatus Nanoarchaeia archaeon]MDD5358031.1 hypothetical protein [Candidatus Nanoarchaeia archaeon]MDD5588950.1 hypothetical protein [Candidatus Nanoarchaeia archaeon]
MKKIKIRYNYNCGKYEVLKPKNGNGWYDVGEKKTIHGLDEFLRREKSNFDFEMSEEIKEQIEKYQKDRLDRKNLHTK